MGAFFGLDIGTSQVKVMQAEKTKEGGFKLKHLGVASLGKNEPVMAVKQALKQAGIKGAVEANVALAESEVYTRIIQTPRLSETELASSIQYEAEQYVPVPLSEVEVYHKVLGSIEEVAQEKMDVLLIAVPKERIKQLTSVLDQAGLMPKSLETELFSTQRVFADASKAQLMVSFGHKTTDLMVLNKGLPLFLHSFSSGGLALTKTLANEFGLTEEQAEQYKRTYGLQEELLEGKVAKMLSPVVDEVIEQIKKAFVYIQQLGGKKAPEQVVIAGGGALLPGLGAYLVKQLNLEVVVGDPFGRFIKDEEFKKLVTNESNPQLATVAGLALKSWL